MALARMYCGVATAEMPSWLTVAAVDDAGRLLDVRHLSDDPAGYAHLGALLGDRVGGSPVAIDRPDHLVTQLLAAANRPLAIAGATAVADFADRFCDETSYDEVRAPRGQRCAVGLARALHAGAVHVTAQSPSVEFEEFKPILAAHAAVTVGRQAAAVALREVLRELYPAALRAYPDPADYLPLTILQTLPEPGLLVPSPSNRGRDAALVAELSASGVADTGTAVAAITALQVAVAESPRWHANRLLAPVVAETVRQSVAAVRACDAASAALMATLIERLAAMSAATRVHARPYLVPAAPVSPAPRRLAGPAAEVPANRVSTRLSAASAAAAGIPAQRPGPMHGSVPGPVPGPAPGSRDDWPLVPAAEDEFATVYPGGLGGPERSARDRSGHERWPSPDLAARDADIASTLAFNRDPLNAPLHHAPLDHAASRGTPLQPPDPPQAPPSWLADARPADARPAESLPLRLVQSPAAHPLTDSLTDPVTARMSPPVLHVIDGDGGRTRRSVNGGPAAAAGGEPDGDLLIFSEAARSAWFTDIETASPTGGITSDTASDTASWGRLADDGWHAAERSAQPAVGDDTTAGLPRRVPQANLVPGSAQAPPRQLRIVRDARSIAAHTEGYFRGWRRGQEIGGFAVGQRDRAAWEFNRDQRARLS